MQPIFFNYFTKNIFEPLVLYIFKYCIILFGKDVILVIIFINEVEQFSKRTRVIDIPAVILKEKHISQQS